MSDDDAYRLATMPTQEAQRSRETAMQAERHFFVQRLQALSSMWRDQALQRVESGPTAMRHCADELDALIAERTK